MYVCDVTVIAQLKMMCCSSIRLFKSRTRAVACVPNASSLAAVWCTKGYVYQLQHLCKRDKLITVLWQNSLGFFDECHTLEKAVRLHWYHCWQSPNAEYSFIRIKFNIKHILLKIYYNKKQLYFSKSKQ